MLLPRSKSYKHTLKKLNYHIDNIQKLCHNPNCKKIDISPVHCCGIPNLKISLMWAFVSNMKQLLYSFKNGTINRNDLIRYSRSIHEFAIVARACPTNFSTREYTLFLKALGYYDELLLYLSNRFCDAFTIKEAFRK